MERRDEHVPFLVRMESIHQALVQIRRDIEETAIGPTEMRRMGGRTGARHHWQPVEGLLLWERERERWSKPGRLQPEAVTARGSAAVRRIEVRRRPGSGGATALPGRSPGGAR
jgi:hypothetical protein